MVVFIGLYWVVITQGRVGMKNTIKVTAGVFALISLTSCQTLTTPTNQNISTEDGVRQLNKIESVQWDKTGDAYVALDNSQLGANQSRVVFIHNSLDQAPSDGINIGIDGVFHTSLHSGQYSQSIVCNGDQLIGVQNSLSHSNTFNDHSFTPFLDPQQTYYYQVALDPQTNKASIKPVEESVALQLLQGLKEQTHQKNRVEAEDCVLIVEEATPVEDPVQVNIPITLDVLFDFDSAKIKPSYKHRLQDVAKFLSANIGMKAILEGHTDSTGPASYNLKLSQARADAVKAELVNKHGIDPSRLTTKGFGESKPIDTNATAQGRQNNRRVLATINEE